MSKNSLAEIESIANVIALPGGLGVEYAASLFVYRMEDSRFAVLLYDHTGSKILEDAYFDSASDAAAAFWNLRQRYQLGADFETLFELGA